MKPLVSIVIPAYNAEAWIAYTVQSAIDQTWPRKEIIVVNDGPRDRTAELVRRFASKEVTSCRREPGLGGSKLCLPVSQGDYIQWLDSDDLLAPDKIERQLAALGTLTTGEHFFRRHGLGSTTGLSTPVRSQLGLRGPFSR